MNMIKKYDVLICVNQNDFHYLKIGQVEDIEYDKDYPSVIKNISVKYQDDTVKYKNLDMEYNFVVMNGNVLKFD